MEAIPNGLISKSAARNVEEVNKHAIDHVIILNRHMEEKTAVLLDLLWKQSPVIPKHALVG